MNSADILLRDVQDSDLPVFFEQQLDPEANLMAAFTSGDPGNRAAFDQHWAKIRSRKDVFNQTILFNAAVAGHVASFVSEGRPEITYWLDREYWGKGIATKALGLFLQKQTEHPLFARAAKDNSGSLRVLEKCGFRIIGSNTDFASARGEEIEEAILILEAN